MILSTMEIHIASKFKIIEFESNILKYNRIKLRHETALELFCQNKTRSICLIRALRLYFQNINIKNTFHEILGIHISC